LHKFKILLKSLYDSFTLFIFHMINLLNLFVWLLIWTIEFVIPRLWFYFLMVKFMWLYLQVLVFWLIIFWFCLAIVMIFIVFHWFFFFIIVIYLMHIINRLWNFIFSYGSFFNLLIHLIFILVFSRITSLFLYSSLITL